MISTFMHHILYTVSSTYMQTSFFILSHNHCLLVAVMVKQETHFLLLRRAGSLSRREESLTMKS